MNSTTIKEQILAQFDELTHSERQLANTMLKNYPMSALGSITLLAEQAKVSTPTVARMIQKLGYKGFPQFQQSLKLELSAKISSPIEKHDKWAKQAPNTHSLNQFTEAVTDNIRQTLAQTDPAIFDSTCDLLANPEKQIYITGGRITRSIAEYFFTHLQMIRPGVVDLHAVSNSWPHYLVDVDKGDVLIIFDIRRYENDLLRLAEIAKQKGMTIVLFTDQWGSPVSKHAKHKFNCQIEAPSAWDSCIVIMLMLEALVAALQNHQWPDTKKRMNALEKLFDQAKLFRKTP